MWELGFCRHPESAIFLEPGILGFSFGWTPGASWNPRPEIKAAKAMGMAGGCGGCGGKVRVTSVGFTEKRKY